MTLTKAQKIYGAALILAAGAFAWDRWSSGSAPAEAAAAVSFAVPRDAKVGAVKAQVLDAPARAGWFQRLARLASDACLDASNPDNAFEPPGWGHERVNDSNPATTIAEARSKADIEAADAFRKHRLDMVMTGPRAYANVDGQGLFIGEVFDGFTLARVTKSTAVFARDQIRVELHLSTEANIKRRGTLIDNSSPKSGNRGIE